MTAWRRIGRMVLVALVVASFAWGGVRIADPFPKAPGAEPVDTDAPAAQIAHDAMGQTEQGDFVVERYRGNDTTLEYVSTTRVDNSDRQYRSRTPGLTGVDGTDGVTVQAYGSEAGRWRRDLQDGSPSSPWYVSRTTRLDVGLFRQDDAVLAADADVSVVSRNASTVVVRVNDTDTAGLLAAGEGDLSASAVRASLTLAVDRDTGLLRWSRYRVVWPSEGGERHVRVVVQRFDRWGDVDVQRPASVPLDFDALYNDLENLCPDCGGPEG